MSWKKHFRVVNPPAPVEPTQKPVGQGVSAKFASYLPEVYAGHPNRIQRYYQFDDMDRDSDINAALDTIADFCTQSEEQNDSPFLIRYTEEPSETETKLVKSYLEKWVRRNDFRSRLWYMIRNTIKNGDAFFLRDPETGEWLWMDHYMVEMVRVDEDGGKDPMEYVVRGLDYARQAKFATTKADPTQYRTPFGTSNAYGARPMVAQTQMNNVFQLAGSARDPRMQRPGAVTPGVDELRVVDAKHVIHLSLSVGMDINWPFGQSVLEPIFKVYKQKELLEDAVLIYRVQRAPERRVFKIDVGSMPPPKAKAHIEQIKNEIHQRRIPNRTGGGASILDAAYNPMCLDLATRVPLLDGRTLTIAELAAEYAAGKENWIYSCDPTTGEVVPGNVTWAGVTRKDAKVLRLVLDNGETITCTPDHKIPVLGKGFVEAKDLSPNDSLIAFNTRKMPISSGKDTKDRTYMQVFDHLSKEWTWVHRMVGEFFRARGKHQEFTFLPENASATKTVIHHKNFDRYDNDPRNLAYMDKNDHIAYHVYNRRKFWEELPEQEADRIRLKISESLRNHYATMSPAQKAQYATFRSSLNKETIARMREERPEDWREWRDRIGALNSAFFQANPDKALERTKRNLAAGINNYRNQSINVTPRMMQILVDTVKEHRPTRQEASGLLSSNVEFMSEFQTANQPRAGHANKIDYSYVPTQRLDLMVTRAGYKGWRDFTKKVAEYNHRIVRIEDAGTMDVGTITVDGKERWHAHHTFAVESGIFVKNSMLEDYFFAVTAEGRGSSVETLPGGDATGEIGDLEYFTKKMARGLRIPTSYLSMGSEESSTPFNDGKLGQALIQEYRFNKYCMRLQSLLSPVFDGEFKRFLRENGIEIDENLFEVHFNPPQNFTKYRQIELDAQQVQVYTQLQDNKRLAERFKLKRFLNLTEEELLENEKLWKEENAAKIKRATGVTPAEAETDTNLASIGVRPGGNDAFSFPSEPEPPPEPASSGMEATPAPDASSPPPSEPGPGGTPL